MTELELLPTGAEPRLLLVAAWLMPFSLISLVGSLHRPFLRAHAFAGTVTGALAVGVLTVGALLPAWLGIPLCLPAGLWLGVSCLRGILAALSGQPPPEPRWVSAWVAWMETH